MCKMAPTHYLISVAPSFPKLIKECRPSFSGTCFNISQGYKITKLQQTELIFTSFAFLGNLINTDHKNNSQQPSPIKLELQPSYWFILIIIFKNIGQKAFLRYCFYILIKNINRHTQKKQATKHILLGTQQSDGRKTSAIHIRVNNLHAEEQKLAM